MLKLAATKVRSEKEESTQDASGFKLEQLKRQLKQLSSRYYPNPNPLKRGKEGKLQRSLGSAGDSKRKDKESASHSKAANRTAIVQYKMKLARTKLSLLKERLKVVLRNCPAVINSLEERIAELHKA